VNSDDTIFILIHAHKASRYLLGATVFDVQCGFLKLDVTISVCVKLVTNLWRFATPQRKVIARSVYGR